MRPIRHKVQGKLFQNDSQAALWLWRDGDVIPDGVTVETLYLRYALIVRGVEQPFFPAELLNDWGETLRGTKVYRWLRKHGELHPRAELFGYDANGNETQYFARDLEIFWKTPCFAISDPNTPITAQIPVEHLLVINPTVPTLEKIKRPAQIKLPLRRASVKWWQIPPVTLASFQFSDQLA